jgi:hypothetical protein
MTFRGKQGHTPTETCSIATLTTASPSRAGLGKILGVQTLKKPPNLQWLLYHKDPGC